MCIPYIHIYVARQETYSKPDTPSHGDIIARCFKICWPLQSSRPGTRISAPHSTAQTEALWNPALSWKIMHTNENLRMCPLLGLFATSSGHLIATDQVRGKFQESHKNPDVEGEGATGTGGQGLPLYPPFDLWIFVQDVLKGFSQNLPGRYPAASSSFPRGASGMLFWTVWICFSDNARSIVRTMLRSKIVANQNTGAT